jgi:ABC-type nitrate/sulfonate/bicarbonate transport system permease component
MPLAGVGVVLATWAVCSSFLGNDLLPYPWVVAHRMWLDRNFYTPHVKATLWEAFRGYCYGNLLAIGLAIAFFGVPVLEKVLLQIGVASYCLPIIAIGPILSTVFHGDAPQVALAGISVFLTTLTSTTLGLRSVDENSVDLVRAYGGGTVKQMRYVRFRSALPGIFTGLQIAAPAAMLGAIVGEWLGADKGFGVAMVVSQQAVNAPRTYGLAAVVAIITGVWYGLTVVVSRLVTPWAPRPRMGVNP